MTTTTRTCIDSYTKEIGKPEVQRSSVPFGEFYFAYDVDVTRGLFISSGFIFEASPQDKTHAKLDERLSAQDRSLVTFFRSKTPLSLHFGLPWPLLNESTQKVVRYLMQHRRDSMTYGDLAQAVFGNHSHARVVATVMSNNFLPVFIPCHLVKSASGEEHYSALGSKNRTDIKSQLVSCESNLGL